jgi:hypothetical protein
MGFGVGLSRQDVVAEGMVGWSKGSWGYHSDDGRIYSENSYTERALEYGQPFGNKDIIGCGVDLKTWSVFWTKNGKHLGKKPSTQLMEHFH